MARRAVHSLALIALALMAAAPLGIVAMEWAGTPHAFSATFLEPMRWRLVGRSAGMALAAAASATALGGALAFAGLPRRGGWLLFFAFIPLIAPPTVYGLGWNAAWRTPYQAPWIAMARCAGVMALAYAPLVLAVALAALRWRDGAGREAARLAGLGRVRRLAAVEIPSLGGPLAAAFAAVFLLSFSQFEIPSALNHFSFPEEVYARFIETYATGPASGLALMAVAPALALAAAIWLRIGGRMRADAAEWRPLPRASGPGVWTLWLVYLAVAVVVPAAGLAWRGFSGLALRTVWPDLVEGLRDTLPLVLAGAVLCLALGWALADLILPSRRWGAAALALALVPAAVAPAVMGIGIIRFWSQPVFGDLVYGRSSALVLALAVRFLAVALLASLAARRALGREFDESARMAGLTDWSRHARLLGPACAPLTLTAAMACAVLMIGELGATTLLSAPGVELLSYRLHSRTHIGPESHIAALAFLHAAVVLLAAAAAWIAARRLWFREGAS